MERNKTNVELEIILILLKNETHLREIARILNTPHSTILRKLNFLAEDNIVDFNIEGKNKKFFLKKNLQSRNIIFNAEKYKLSKLLREYPMLNIVLEDILKNTKERMIIIFGSYAKSLAKKESDIDVYIETTTKRTKHEIQELNSKLSVKIGSFDLSSLLIKEIIKDHVILKGVEEFYERTNLFE